MDLTLNNIQTGDMPLNPNKQTKPLFLNELELIFCTHLNGFKYSKLDILFLLIDGTLPLQVMVDLGVMWMKWFSTFPQSFWNGALSSDSV